MSSVTTITIRCASFENYHRKIEESLPNVFNDWITNYNNKYIGQFETKQYEGGPKADDGLLFHGAFNYLPFSAFVEFFTDYKWRSPQSVHMIVEHIQSSYIGPIHITVLQLRNEGAGPFWNRCRE